MQVQMRLQTHWVMPSSTCLCVHQVLQAVPKALLGTDALPVTILPLDRFGDPKQLLMVMALAGFQHIKAETYDHPMKMRLPDLVDFAVGPKGELGLLLQKVYASGRPGVYHEAEQVFKLVCWYSLVQDTRVQYHNGICIADLINAVTLLQHACPHQFALSNSSLTTCKSSHMRDADSNGFTPPRI